LVVVAVRALCVAEEAAAAAMLAYHPLMSQEVLLFLLPWELEAHQDTTMPEQEYMH
jgi:hypothetical protein